MSAAQHTIHLPSGRDCFRHAGRHIVEGAIIPTLTFYLVLTEVSLHWALLASLMWSYLIISVRLSRRRRVPGLVLVSAGLITVRTVVALGANSSFLYFLQPSIGNFCIAVLFLASLVPGKPMTRRLAEDFCVVPAALDARPRFAQFFVRLTILWAFVCAANGLGTLFLLLHSSLGAFIALRPVFSYGLVAVGTLVSYLWFRTAMRGERVHIKFGHPQPVPAEQPAVAQPA